MYIFKNVFRLIWLTLSFPSIFLTSQKLRRWVKKNTKLQDPDNHDFEKRMNLANKAFRKVTQKLGVKVEIKGADNMPKGACWITPNHSSTFDFAYLGTMFEKLEKEYSAVIKEELLSSKLIEGFATALEAFSISKNSLRLSIAKMNQAAIWSKSNNRGVVVFPEGTRHLDGKLGDFKPGSFSFPKKFYIPIVPITITGCVLASNLFSFRKRKVTIIIHKPLKPQRIINLSSTKIADLVKNKIQLDLDKYYDSLSKNDKKNLEKKVEKLSKNKKHF